MSKAGKLKTAHDVQGRKAENEGEEREKNDSLLPPWIEHGTFRSSV